MTLREYAENAIDRIRSGQALSAYGSHLGGIFGKAAQEFEEEMRQFLCRVLQASNLSYDKDCRHLINGPVFTMLTLGQIIDCLEKLKKFEKLDPDPQKKRTLEDLCRRASSINNLWAKRLKRGKGFDEQQCLKRLETMLVCLDLMKRY